MFGWFFVHGLSFGIVLRGVGCDLIGYYLGGRVILLCTIVV